MADTQLAQAEAGKARETAESQGGHGFRCGCYKGSHTLPFLPSLGLLASFMQPLQDGNRQLLLSPGRSPAIPGVKLLPPERHEKSPSEDCDLLGLYHDSSPKPITGAGMGWNIGSGQVRAHVLPVRGAESPSLKCSAMGTGWLQRKGAGSAPPGFVEMWGGARCGQPLAQYGWWRQCQ